MTPLSEDGWATSFTGFWTHWAMSFWVCLRVQQIFKNSRARKTSNSTNLPSINLPNKIKNTACSCMTIAGKRTWNFRRVESVASQGHNTHIVASWRKLKQTNAYNNSRNGPQLGPFEGGKAKLYRVAKMYRRSRNRAMTAAEDNALSSRSERKKQKHKVCQKRKPLFMQHMFLDHCGQNVCARRGYRTFSGDVTAKRPLQQWCLWLLTQYLESYYDLPSTTPQTRIKGEGVGVR